MLLRILGLLVLLTLLACQPEEVPKPVVHAPFLQDDSTWADSILARMSTAQKVGQLLVWAPRSAKQLHPSTPQDLASQQAGGFLLQDLPLDSFLLWRDRMEAQAAVLPFFGTRERISLHGQFNDLTPFPLPATLSSSTRDSALQQLERRYVRHCQALGINFSLAPTLAQNRPERGQYNYQVLTNDSTEQRERSQQLLYALQNEHILSIGGQVEAIKTSPSDSLARHQSTLGQLSHEGLSGMRYRTGFFRADTLRSRGADYLARYAKARYDFDGLHWADASSSQTVVAQLLAGAEVLLVPDSLGQYRAVILEALRQKRWSEADLDRKVRRILRAKNWIRCANVVAADRRAAALAELRDPQLDRTVREWYEASLVLAQNRGELLPFQNLAQKRFEVIQVGPAELSHFSRELGQYTQFRERWIQPQPGGGLAPLKPRQYRHRTVVLALSQQNLAADQHAEFIASVNAIAREGALALVNFGNPYNLQFFDSTLAMIQVMEQHPVTETYAVQALFGGRNTPGRLPLRVATHLPRGHGGNLSTTRLAYAEPEEVGIASFKLVGIDAIARSAISKRAIPGCQVMVLKEGKVIYDKNFGHQSIHRRRAVADQDLYDLASITKVAATTLALMKLYENGRVKLRDRLEKHLELGEDSPLRKLTLWQLLTHQSGLQAHMPITPFVMARDSNSRDCTEYFCYEERDDYQIPVADSFFLRQDYLDTLWQAVYQLEPKRRKRYRYSDVNFALLQRVVEAKTGKDFDRYLQQQFYTPLHLKRTGFRPLDRFPQREIIPTAHDELWRKQVVHGYVHDETAALLRGVAGNAGLFSNSRDLGILFQMLLNGGTYGGRRYLQQSTIDYFTRTQSKGYRGLGFDKRNKRLRRQACSPKASKHTYGHTGFTGSCIWVDPAEDLVFIFLTNRINEDYHNKGLFRERVRRRMHTVVYDALRSYRPGQRTTPAARTQPVQRAEASFDLEQ
ncbi:MAG: serine hydrolase [Bacteroidota bacterium]